MNRAVLIFVLVIGSATNLVAAEEEPERTSLAFDAGFILYYADEADIWKPGNVAGITGLHALGKNTCLGAHVGLLHWGYDDSRVVPTLIPDGAEPLARQSSGQLQMIEFGPVVRFARDRFLDNNYGLYIQLSGNMVYMKTSVLTEVMYLAGGARSQIKTFEIDETRYRIGFSISGGLSRPISTSSWIELFPSYRSILTDGSLINLVGISLAYRAEL